MKRRDFIKCGITGMAALAYYVTGGSRFEIMAKETAMQGVAKKEATGSAFAFLEASGAPHEIGLHIGREFKHEIHLGFEGRRKWFEGLKEFACGEGRSALATMMETASSQAPRVVEELQGCAEGSGISYEDLFILNCNNEFEAYMEEQKKPPGDCSTVVLKEKERLIIAHNEDGNKAYEDLMFVLKARPAADRSFLAVTYPGIVSGNAPALNSHGIALTTNYIGAKEVKAGIPRYFISRMILEATSLEEALEIARTSGRSHSYHHIIASLPEKKVFSIEATPSRFEIRKISGLYLHTNHLILEKMKNSSQFEKYVSLSSVPRLESLQKNLGTIKDISSITPEMIIKALSCHDGKPYSVCRHPQGEVEGATLCTALFVAQGAGGEQSIKLYRNNPCKGKLSKYTL